MGRRLHRRLYRWPLNPQLRNAMEHGSESQHNRIHMPAPTAWPMVLALGVSLLIAGMVTSVAVSLLGLVLMLFSAIGWFRSVLPVEAHEFVEAEADRKSTRLNSSHLGI